MDEYLIVLLLAILGLMFGSFAGASVWRLRAKQLREDEAAGETVDAQEMDRLRPLTQKKMKEDRSQCLHCGHQLAWYDLIPLVSWLTLRGKCRYCHQKIGTFEPLVEIGMGLFFVGSYLLWPVPLTTGMAIAAFVLWLIAGVMLAILFIYDLKWYLLPDEVMFPLIGLSGVAAITTVLTDNDPVQRLLSVAGGVTILSGIYYVLWHVSKGQWIGFGDIKLGLALALILSDWKLAFLTLFAANLLGLVIILPGLMTGKISRTSRVPFGPLMIGGYILTMLYGEQLIRLFFTVTI